MRDPSHFRASIRSAIARAGVVTFVAASLTFAAAAMAGAQTLPAADPQTPAADQAAPAPAEQPNPTVAQAQAPTKPPARPAPPPPPLSHLPIIDFVATFTQPTYYTNNSQLPAYDPVDLGGTVRFPITRKFSLIFDRITEGTINQPLERQLLPAPNLPKDTRDILLQYHGVYIFNRFLAVDAGESFRHRAFASGTGPGFAFNTNISARPYPYTLSSTEHHFAYLGFTYTTKPWKEFLNSVFALTETGEAQNVDHHVAILCSAAMVAAKVNSCVTAGNVGYLDENPNKSVYYTTTQNVAWIWPVDARRGTTFTLLERWGYLNFYENQPYPWRWTLSTNYTLSKRFSPGFTLAMRHQDLHEALVSAPFPGGGFVHVGSWDVIGTFHVDTNTFFH